MSETRKRNSTIGSRRERYTHSYSPHSLSLFLPRPLHAPFSFPNLGILHVTKKNVSRTLEDRMVEAIRMGHNHGVSIHPDIDSQQGELRVPRELTGQSLCASVCVSG